MNICFFNCNHIGDIFFAQPFILSICKNNPSVTFYYWFYVGHVFFENKCSNLKYLENNICREYKNKLVNGYPPEVQTNNDKRLEQLFKSLAADYRYPHFIFSYKSIDYIALNVHCISMGCSRDLCINSAIKSYINSINILNNKYGLNINNLNKTNDFLPDITNTNINIDKFLKWHTSNSNKNYIFFYNFKTRSLDYFNTSEIIRQLSLLFTNLIFIVPVLDTELENLNNVKSCDTDFDCFYDSTCLNLLMIEKIQLFCKSIIIIPTGASWMFMNNNIKNYIDKNIYILENEKYANLLNEWYNFCNSNNTNICTNNKIVNNLNLDNLFDLCKNLNID